VSGDDVTEGLEVNHYLRLSRVEHPSEAGPVLEGRAPIDTHLRGDDGRGMRTGVLLALVDSIGGFTCGLAVLPRWIVSTNIQLQVARVDHTGPLRFDATVLRRGSSAAVGAVVVSDEGDGDAHVAHGVVTCAVLEPAEPKHFDRPIRFDESPQPASPESLESFFAIAPGSGSETTLELADRLRNPWGILHGGATSVLLDVAAVRAAGIDGGAVADTVVHFLAPVRVGPVTARCTITGDRPDGRLVHVAVHDAGNDDRVCVLASVVVRRPPSEIG
jgi:acyl-coenzyme A thioesterase PaaI-like protein